LHAGKYRKFRDKLIHKLALLVVILIRCVGSEKAVATAVRRIEAWIGVQHSD